MTNGGVAVARYPNLNYPVFKNGLEKFKLPKSKKEIILGKEQDWVNWLLIEFKTEEEKQKLADLKTWTDAFPSPKTAETVKKEIQDLIDRPDIPISKAEWDNDWSKRVKSEAYKDFINPADKDKLVAEAKGRYGMLTPEEANAIRGENKQLEYSIKTLLGIGFGDPLPMNWETALIRRESLTEAKRKLQEYEEGLKIELKLDDNTLKNWRVEIAKLNKPVNNYSAFLIQAIRDKVTQALVAEDKDVSYLTIVLQGYLDWEKTGTERQKQAIYATKQSVVDALKYLKSRSSSLGI